MPQPPISQIRSQIQAIDDDPDLHRETSFERRADAIELLEFDVIDRVAGLLQASSSPELLALKGDAERVKRGLDAVDDALFRRLRSEIRAGGCTGAALLALIDEYVPRDAGGTRGEGAAGYDALDLFVNGLLLAQGAPRETRAREPEMVFYQPTPARIILELVRTAGLTEEDVFYDLGSGLGQVPILVRLLSKAAAKGVEVEPAYCDFARACAADLGLSGVELMEADARAADYGDGTVFFMYTPFRGRMLQEVLGRLRTQSSARTIRLFTYGPCTPEVARQPWLERTDTHGSDVHRLAAFRSR
jgi:hypothetical protein